MTPTCRAATAADLRALCTVRVRSWQAAYRGLVPQSHLDALDVDAEVARRSDRWEPGGHLLAELDGRIVGWAYTGPYRGDDLPAGSGEVYAIYALPEHWSAGVGRALMARALRDLDRRAFAPVFLWVLRDNDRARHFYQRVGFAADGGTHDFDVAGVSLPELRYRHPGLHVAGADWS